MMEICFDYGKSSKTPEAPETNGDDREIQKGNLREPDCLAGEEQQAA